jgi:hypothetical protein
MKKLKYTLTYFENGLGEKWWQVHRIRFLFIKHRIGNLNMYDCRQFAFSSRDPAFKAAQMDANEIINRLKRKDIRVIVKEPVEF